jgi:hypothetical protein
MHRLVISATIVAAVALVPTGVSAHGGGHQGGCEDFGHINREIGKDPAAFGFPGARNLGDIVSSFAHLDDAHAGVSDIVENVDHQACGPQ